MQWLNEKLNQNLFHALERRFRHVEVVNPGTQALVTYQPHYDFLNGKARMNAHVSGGESYKVNCLFCDDTRMRLVFNHLWGTFDERTQSVLLHPVICFNENCVSTRERQIALRESLNPQLRLWRERRAALRGTVIPPPPAAPEPVEIAPTIEMPDGCSATMGHISSPAARRYLRERGFDRRELERNWGVSYCEYSDEPSPRFRDRIVIPIRTVRSGTESRSGKRRTVLAGWQARLIREPEDQDEPKYLTCRGMKKSQLLYALPQALETSGPIVICEGVTDVWRLGSRAVALFGKDLSRHQEQLMVQHFRGRPLVLFLDRDAREQAEKAARRLRSARAAMDDSAVVAIARHPKGRNDIGECSYEEAWRCVARALEISVAKLRLTN